MLFKRVWLWRLRSRSQMRPAVLVVICLAATIFVFDSALTMKDTDRGHFSYPEERHSFIPDTTQTPLLQDFYNEASHVMNSSGVSAASRNDITLQPLNEKENYYLDRHKDIVAFSKTTQETFSNDGLVILSENVRNHNEKNEESVRIAETNKSANESPSFGFVNKDFKLPPPRQRRGSGLVDVLQDFVKGESLINPGSLLGIVAALKQLETFRQTQSKGEEIRNDSKQSQAGVASVPETHYDKGQQLKADVLKETEIDSHRSQAQNAKGEGEQGNQPLPHAQIPSRPGGNGMKGVLGVMSSLLSHNGSPGGNVLGSLMTNLAPVLLSGARTRNDRQMEGAAGMSKPSPLQALVGGLGPLLLAGFEGFGGSKRDPDSLTDSGNTIPLHTIISQVGSSLMAESALHPNSRIPLQSLLANFAPALLSAFTQGNNQYTDGKGTAHSNPVQAILGGLVPALMSGTLQQGLGTNNMDKRNPSPQSPLQAIVSGMGQSVLKGKQTGLGGFLAEVAPVLMAGAARRGSRTLKGTEGEAETGHDYNNVASHADHEIPDSGSDVGGPMVKWLLRGVVSSMLPEELPVPEMNSTRTPWDMAVNLAFGNPRDDRGRNSMFWQWVREYIGGEAPLSSENTEETTPAWITAALTTQAEQRQANVYTLTKVYQRLEGSQPLCQHIRSVGGLFSWMKGVLSNARDVCMDADVAPRSKGCTVYSFGLRDSWNFEEDMEDMGCEVWAFDPTMTTGNHNHSSHIHFYNLGLAASSASNTITKEEQRRHLFPLAEVMERLGHTTSTIDYLKLDIGGSEWEVLHETAKHSRHALTNLRQLGVEVHLEAALRDPNLYNLYLDALEGLESLGFQLFSSRVTQKPGWSYHDPLLDRRVSLHYDLAFFRV